MPPIFPSSSFRIWSQILNQFYLICVYSEKLESSLIFYI